MLQLPSPSRIPNINFLVADLQMALNQPFVVKPRHGSNSKHVTICRPQQAGCNWVAQLEFFVGCLEVRLCQKRSWVERTPSKQTKNIYSYVYKYMYTSTKAPHFLSLSLSLSVAKNAFIDIYLHLYYIYIYTNKYALYIRLYRLSHLYSAYAAIMDVIDVPSSW